MVVDNFLCIKKQINEAAECRSVAEPKIVAVSKKHSSDKIKKLIGAGHLIFGENKIQEAVEKYTPLKSIFPDIELHFIGKLQRNKVKHAVDFFDVIHSIDSPKLAEKVACEMSRQRKRPNCFIQVNVGNESQKSGVEIESTNTFIRYCIDDLNLPIKGLMCIPPANKPPEVYFNSLKEISNLHNLNQLSMGMSEDYKIAISCGSTLVRIGTAIFGKRDYD